MYMSIIGESTKRYSIHVNTIEKIVTFILAKCLLKEGKNKKKIK